ncbi:anti sigma factor C-terminal domain-containing protein [Aquibacillus rhizosphaerae]|uniref:Anti sigma factor C-terminal domain-containing protein n=1 Tax=Aquibacillus rhizosphaerae TaxID=3051431 RepID=A0ABT7L1I3_9BACI|nr:anti sigma factor C-terminal domain-containing protein [Aquibacillus sp. LR5S19]MDL4839657.1 anti sigma factor C-terminal domain-containing protein [Aquibacillus sp. LR5S19]
MKKDDVLSEWNESEEQTDEKSAKKLVWRTRLSISFTVVRMLLLIFLLYVIYMIPISIYYEMSGKSAEFDRLVTTLVETRHPGIAVEKSGSNEAEINPFLTQHTSINLYRQVGDWQVVVGEVTAKKWVFGQINYTVDLDKKFLNNDNTTFVVAPDLLGNTFTEYDSGVMTLAEQLGKIDDGYVVQANFSTKESMTPEELRDIISKYDVTIQQMPVYGGELTEFETSYSKAGQFTFIPSLMLRPYTQYGDENRLSSWFHSLNEQEGLSEAVEKFYDDIAWLIDKGSYQEKDIDQKRLDYINENGLNVYGATVTGPIREIERLEEEVMFHQFELGGIEVWKWDGSY